MPLSEPSTESESSSYLTLALAFDFVLVGGEELEDVGEEEGMGALAWSVLRESAPGDDGLLGESAPGDDEGEGMFGVIWGGREGWWDVGGA